VRKMGHAAAGMAVNVARLHDENPRVWDWAAATRVRAGDPEAVLQAITAVKADAAVLRLDLADAPEYALPPRPSANGHSVDAARLFDLAARLEAAKPEEESQTGDFGEGWRAAEEYWEEEATRAEEESRTDDFGEGWRAADDWEEEGLDANEKPAVSAVARLFEIAAEQEWDTEHSWPGTPSREKRVESHWVVTPPKNPAGQELLSLLKGQVAPLQQAMGGDSAGRELLGLLNPASKGVKPKLELFPAVIAAEEEEEKRNRVAQGIWGALGRRPWPALPPAR